MTEASQHAAGAPGRIIHGTWLEPQLLTLLLEVCVPTLEGPRWRVLANQGGEVFDIGMRWCGCAPRGGEGDPRLCLLTIALPPFGLDKRIEWLALHEGGQRIGLLPQPAHRTVTTVQPFAAACRSRIAPPFRPRALALLVDAPRAHRRELTRELAGNLCTLRDALREPLPSTKREPRPPVFRLERVIGLDDSAFWCSGFIHDVDPRAARLIAVAPEGARTEVAPEAVWYHPRPGVAAGLRGDGSASTLGFDAYVELPHPSRSPSGWVMEFHTTTGASFEHLLPAPALTADEEAWEFASARENAAIPSPNTFEAAFLPAVQRLRTGARAPQISRTFTFGDVPARPEASVVIPAEDALQVEQTVVAFAGDSELARAEIIYVVYSEDEDDLVDQVESLHNLHRLALRLVMLTRPTTRLRATNLGAHVAAGRLLLVMSSAVLPGDPGWLGRLVECYDSAEEIRAVGPKLLREDDSIAFAGLNYGRRASGRWERRTTLAGLPRDTPGAQSPRRVHAVPDTCMLVERERFGDVGGFCDLYLRDGEEGLDLCLRLAADGETWYEPRAELYLLDEGEQQDAVLPLHGAYNRWLLDYRCAGALQALSAASGLETVDGWGNAAGPASTDDAPPAAGPEAPFPTGPRLELLALESFNPEGGSLLASELIEPDHPTQRRSPWPDTYTLAVAGWALPREAEPVAVELRHGERVLHAIEATLPSEGIAVRFPDHPRAEACGFRLFTTSLRLPQEFVVTVEAVTGEDERTVLGSIRGRRRPLRTRHRPRVQPLLVTTLGRSGSRRLVDLLAQAPEIVALVPNMEGRLAEYWMDVLQALSEPKAYMQMILPELIDEHWWLGNLQTPPARLVADGTLPRWLGQENIEELAAFCQTRFDDFYRRTAAWSSKPGARYFAEKTGPRQAANLVHELYPDGRELVLVRDLRDVVCSIDAYNAKRGFQLWGRQAAADEASWFADLAHGFAELLSAYRERCAHAHLVRYEELVTNPVRTLAGVFRYLDIDASEARVRRVVDAADSFDPAGQRFHQTSPSVADSIGRWKRELTPERRALFAENFDDILIELEYEPTEAALAKTA